MAKLLAGKTPLMYADINDATWKNEIWPGIVIFDAVVLNEKSQKIIAELVSSIKYRVRPFGMKSRTVTCPDLIFCIQSNEPLSIVFTRKNVDVRFIHIQRVIGIPG
jgi:hypothetical protein